jgi:hypothetical protein
VEEGSMFVRTMRRINEARETTTNTQLCTKHINFMYKKGIYRLDGDKVSFQGVAAWMRTVQAKGLPPTKK